MKDDPGFVDILRVHIWSPIMAVGMLSILFFAGQYLGDWQTVAKIEMLFGSAPDTSGAWLIIPQAIIVGAGHALFLGAMLKEMYGRDDIYRHFMGKGPSLCRHHKLGCRADARAGCVGRAACSYQPSGVLHWRACYGLCILQRRRAHQCNDHFRIGRSVSVYDRAFQSELRSAL